MADHVLATEPACGCIPYQMPATANRHLQPIETRSTLSRSCRVSVAITLGVWSISIVFATVDELDRDLEELEDVGTQ